MHMIIEQPLPPDDDNHDEEHFSAAVEEREDRAIVRVAGELDLGTADGLETTLLALLERHPLVTLDLRALEFMDSTGIGILVGANAAAAERGVAFRVVRGPEPVQRVLAITGVDAHLTMVDEPADAAP